MTSETREVVTAASAGSTRRGGRTPLHPPHRTGYARSNARSGYWFILPALAVMAALIVYPLVFGFVISFFNTNLVNRWEFVGFDYFVRAFQNAQFMKSLGITAFYALSTVAGTMVVGTT